MKLAAAVALALTCAACSSVDSSAFAKYQATSPIALSQGNAPDNTEPLSLVWAQRSGLYIFGMFPVVRADLETTLDLLVAEARKLGADGIAHIAIIYEPASFFSLHGWPFPWISTLSLSGTAWRKK